MRLPTHRHWAPALSAAILVVLTTAGFSVSAAPARADAYPYCPPKVDADCFLLNQINDKISPIAAGQEGPLIAEAHRACDFMKSDHSGTNPMLDYSVWLARQPAGNTTVISNPTQFALFAARAYCPSTLP